jgi:phosphate transport system protein
LGRIKALKQFEQELAQLKQRLLRMASLVEKAVHSSMQALLESNESAAKKVIEEDKEVNRQQLQIDEEVLRVLALHRPVGADLRFGLSVIRINSNLERIGDQAVNIAEAVLRIVRYPRVKPRIDMPRMSGVAQEMVRDSIDALVQQDVNLAESVLPRDDLVDGLRDNIFRELLTYMVGHPSMMNPVFDLILVTKDLERIGDLATNIAEEVIYILVGKDVRHDISDKACEKEKLEKSLVSSD